MPIGFLGGGGVLFSFEAHAVPFKIHKGTYDVRSGKEEENPTDLIFEMYYQGKNFYPCVNQKHYITSMEKTGRFYDGNYLYAIEGNFDIKIDNSKYQNYQLEDDEIKEYRLECKYRMIVESDYFAENE